MSEEQHAEIVRLKEALDECNKKLKRSTSTCFEPGDELVWFDEGEVNTLGAHTHISGPRNYFIHQADGRGSDQLFTVKRYDEETSTATIIGRDLPDWETAKAVAQADFDAVQEAVSWTLMHPRATMEMLGHIPSFFSDADPRPAREQLAARYGSGWDPLPGCSFSDGLLCYSDDPPEPLLAETKLRDETLRFFNGAWLAIIQPDGSFEVGRVD